MKRKQELQEFNEKTETKEGLFDELKRMDMNLKDKQADIKKKEEGVINKFIYFIIKKEEKRRGYCIDDYKKI